jgi:hypothetical protein
VGILKIEEINTIGKLAKPPVPITNFGLYFIKINIDCIRLIISLSGKTIFLSEKDL